MDITNTEEILVEKIKDLRHIIGLAQRENRKTQSNPAVMRKLLGEAQAYILAIDGLTAYHFIAECGDEIDETDTAERIEPDRDNA